MKILNRLTITHFGTETVLDFTGRKKWSWSYAKRKLKKLFPDACLTMIQAIGLEATNGSRK